MSHVTPTNNSTGENTNQRREPTHFTPRFGADRKIIEIRVRFAPDADHDTETFESWSLDQMAVHVSGWSRSQMEEWAREAYSARGTEGSNRSDMRVEAEDNARYGALPAEEDEEEEESVLKDDPHALSRQLDDMMARLDQQMAENRRAIETCQEVRRTHEEMEAEEELRVFDEVLRSAEGDDQRES